MKMNNVLIGMSGGVDSSTAVHLLKKDGYEVEGLSLIIWEARNRTNITSCCSIDAINEAKITANTLGIKHSTIDARTEFIDKVIDPFVNSYIKGSTPNPCILCNRYIKFPFLMDESANRGFSNIATGHYAIIDSDSILKKAVDPIKDQSYFLYAQTPEQLKKILFPLGQYNKAQVRQIAADLNLSNANKPESQEICFIDNNDYRGFLRDYIPNIEQQGIILDIEGKILGRHNGIFGYTIGQRRGLGISSDRPLYVQKIDVSTNTIIMGHKEDLYVSEINLFNLHWLIDFNSLKDVNSKIKIKAKLRSTMKETPAYLLVNDDGSAKLIFDQQEWGAARGQSAVFYSENVVLGGGIVA